MPYASASTTALLALHHDGTVDAHSYDRSRTHAGKMLKRNKTITALWWRHMIITGRAELCYKSKRTEKKIASSFGFNALLLWSSRIVCGDRVGNLRRWRETFGPSAHIACESETLLRWVATSSIESFRFQTQKKVSMMCLPLFRNSKSHMWWAIIDSHSNAQHGVLASKPNSKGN